MPMSFAASLGTTITIIGAPAFLIADGLLRQAGRPGLSIFSIAPIGLALTAIGTLFVLLNGRALLPDREGRDDSGEQFRLTGYFTELVLMPDSPLLGKTVREMESMQEAGFEIMQWFRDGAPRARPFGRKKTRAGDILLVRTGPDRVASVQQERGVELHSLHKYAAEVPELNNGHEKDELPSRLVQAVVAPRSELIGKTIGGVDFLRSYGVIVVSLWRRTGRLRTELSRAALREGDVLVMAGEPASLKRISDDASFLLLAPFHGETKLPAKAPLAAGIMLVSIVVASLNVFPVEIVFLAGAAAMILTGCLTARQAYQSIDTRIFVFIAGAIPLGLAMQSTGTAGLLAGWLQVLVAHWDIHWTLLGLFLLAGLLTQLMSELGHHRAARAGGHRAGEGAEHAARAVRGGGGDGLGGLVLHAHRPSWQPVDLRAGELPLLRLRAHGCPADAAGRHDRHPARADVVALIGVHVGALRCNAQGAPPPPISPIRLQMGEMPRSELTCCGVLKDGFPYSLERRMK